MAAGQLTAFGPKDEVLKKVLEAGAQRYHEDPEPRPWSPASSSASSEPVRAHRPPALDFGLRRRLYAGLAVAGFLVFGIGSWAAVAKLSGAVIASG